LKLPMLVTCVAVFAHQALAQTRGRTSPTPSAAEKMMTQLAGTWRMVGTQQRMSDGTVRAAAGNGPVNEDVFPVLEYEAPKAFFLGHLSHFLDQFDERRHATNRSLFFSRYRADHSLNAEEAKDIANYHFKTSAPDWARPFVEVWMRQSPNDPEAWWASVRLEANRGNKQVALQELSRLISMQPDRREYVELAARLAAEEFADSQSFINPASPDKALTYLSRLAAFDLDGKDKVFQRMAEIYAASGNYGSAADFFDRAATFAQAKRAYADASRLWLEASDIAAKANDIKAVEAYVRRALAVDPQNAVAKSKLKRLKS